MSTGVEDMSGGPVQPSREQVLDELDYLASVEHALCVEYLLIYGALGQDLDLPADAGPILKRVSAAAQEALSIAEGEMRHLSRLNKGLALAGRPPQVGRASSIRSDSVSDIAFGLLSPAQLEGFLDRETAIASAVDESYARLRPAVAPQNALFEDELLDQMSFILDTCSDHSTPLAALRGHLEGLAPSEYLRAIRSEPTNELERSLLELSGQQYGLIVTTVQASFAHDDELGGDLLTRAVSTMDGLNEINRLLVERGLLPTFGLPIINA